ncbi:hypothetical protein EVAR_103011_1 [Eumeta japonica]|uniref:Uncharacterized protein n=1 Tax=Eumeta variegata TaxID=151549 RepID=A0A4C1WET5_EUMVA|nr:hypothetical protein EVAR_103011_1 [Eumeta japonica]
MSNVETKRLRTNHTNIQKQTLKALQQAKKTENGRQMEETCPFLLYLLTHYSIYYPSLIQFLAKGCMNTDWLYTPSLLIRARTCTLPYNYAPFGVSGLVPFVIATG